jgi:glycosyltransferase involved in cell wall biosynthesis
VDRWQYFQAADAMVLPTKSENFGFAVLEALWVGTPVVTTTFTPWNDYPPNCGVHICDSNVGAVRAKLIEVCSKLPINPAWRDRISSHCKARYHWNRLQADYQTTYQQVLENGQPD